MRPCGHVISNEKPNLTLGMPTWCTLIVDKKCFFLVQCLCQPITCEELLGGAAEELSLEYQMDEWERLPALLFLASQSTCVILCYDCKPSDTPD